MPLKGQGLLFPRTSDENDHVDRSATRPQETQHLRSVPHVEAVRQRLPGTLSFYGVPITRRGCFFWGQFVERRPVAECPDTHPEFGQTHRVALKLHDAM